MKYSININQLVLSETPLDITDAAILDYLYNYCNSNNAKIDKYRFRDEDGTVWTWVNYSALIVSMPLLRIKSKNAISSRIKKIKETGYLLTRLENGDKLFITLTELVDKLYIK